MSSRSHYAVDIIANCIDVGTKQDGGEGLALSLSERQTLCGARHIRSLDLGFALGAAVNLIQGKGGEPCPIQSIDLEHQLWPKAQAELVNPEEVTHRYHPLD
jgi:hypothetical protein